MAVNVNTIAERLAAQYSHMTKKQRQLADYMLDNAEAMSFMTLKDLAAAVGISEMTVLHACTAWGYANYNELKYEFRKYISLRGKIDIQREDGYGIPAVPEYDLGDKRHLLA